MSTPPATIPPAAPEQIPQWILKAAYDVQAAAMNDCGDPATIIFRHYAAAHQRTPAEVPTEDQIFAAIESGFLEKHLPPYGFAEDVGIATNKVMQLIKPLTTLTAQLTKEREEARELLREIRDNEVNAADEADKFLRDHVPSALSAAQSRLADLEKALGGLLRHPIGVSTDSMDVAQARAALRLTSQEGKTL